MSHSTSDSLKPLPTRKGEEVNLIVGNPAGLPKVAFECPSCHWIVRSEVPDGKHPFPSVVKPGEGSFVGDVLVQNFVCRNPRCKEHFVVYWFESKDYFNRI
jgi:hypothetical protein